MSHWFFIINPTAGHRNGLRVWKSIQKELIKRKVEHRSFLTEHPGHAEVLARQISTIQEYKLKRLIVIGGDGTMHEVVNGLKDVDDIELSFVPAGAYNDFSRGFSIKKIDLIQEIKKVKRPLTRTFHLGSVNFLQDKSQILYFMNHIGIGFDAYVNKKAMEFPLRRALHVFFHSFYSFISGFDVNSCVFICFRHPIHSFKALFKISPRTRAERERQPNCAAFMSFFKFYLVNTASFT